MLVRARSAAKAHRRELARDRRRLVERLTKEHLDAAAAAEDTEGSTTATQERYLIVLDGTWSEAGRLLNQNERLKSWPVCCRLPGPEDSAGQPLQPGEFARCRAPPQDGFVSTLEAIGRALVALSQADDEDDEEGGRAAGRGAARTQAAAATEGRFGRQEYDALLAPLREMVRLQEGFVARPLVAPEPEPT